MESHRTSYIENVYMSMNPSPLQTSLRCTQCNARPNVNGRNLAVCIDGTSNRFGKNNTNVVKLFANIDLERSQNKTDQYAYYSSGVGTSAKSLNIFSRMVRTVADKFDMAIAWNMEEIVKDAYGWLARTYQDGDQIYLFGFSRGAYQVRVLAGMIHEVGLIRTPTEKQIGTAYGHYEKIRSRKPKTRQVAREFKNTFSREGLRVHFVGVWDTVSSVGLIRGDVFLSTSSSAAHACHFRHALALDELRVKFMPEYFHEMNSPTYSGKSKSTVTARSTQHVGTASKRRMSTMRSNSGFDFFDDEKTSEIREVWFAGSHSDVGGKNRPGQSSQAGNVSLLWMRREVAANGLVLKPTDIVWVPDDLDSGISDSMSLGWRLIEYLPIKHQISFSGGADNDARRRHRLRPRRIIPGQKVHASILYANAYKPHATRGEGFDIPIIQPGFENTELDKEIWETGLFDETAAEELVAYLGEKEGVAPIYLDRLLFMLRFEEGKQCVKNVPDWQNQFKSLIGNDKSSWLVRLVTIVAYYEASCDSNAHVSCALLDDLEIFNGARNYLNNITSISNSRDGPRVVALLRPLAKHPELRERILAKEVLKTLTELFDGMIAAGGGNFGQAMDGLSCLLQCEETETRQFIVEKLGAHRGSRLSQILDVDKPHLLTAALRMMSTLARVPEAGAKAACAEVKPRIKELVRKHQGLVGLLAAQVMLVLYDPEDRGAQVNIHSTRVRANLANALVCLNSNRHGEGDRILDSGQRTLHHIFGLGVSSASDLNRDQKKLISELEKTARKGNVRERTAATLTLLKLCETEVIRAYLCGTDLFNAFVSQLRRKDSALLAAHALATCLQYDDMQFIKDKEDLPKHIVGMLILDYFDDAVGHVEGFQIFRDLMRQDDLRQKIEQEKMTEVLKAKLGKGKPKETRTSLMCLEILRSFNEDGPWIDQLVDKSLKLLQDSAWTTQNTGVTILSALVQTKYGVAAIRGRINEIMGMLLPQAYLPTSEVTESQTSTSRDTSSWMMGPACALRILVQNKELRNHIRNTKQYSNLKDLFLSGTLVDETDTPPWRIWTPNRSDVVDTLDKMIKTVDGELSEEGPMSIGDSALPQIQHWDRLMGTLRNRVTLGVAAVLPVLGVSALAIIAISVATPIYASYRAYDLFQQRRSRSQDLRILDDPPDEPVVQVVRTVETGPGVREFE